MSNGTWNAGRGTNRALAVIIGMALLAFLLLVSRLPLPTVEAQAPTRVTGQTFPSTYKWTPNGTAQFFSVPNLGQAGHSIAFPLSVYLYQCSLFFQGSNDKTNWTTINSLAYDGVNTVSYATSNGQFQFFRLAWNPSADAGCALGTPLTAYYVGYSFPNPSPTASTNFSFGAVSTPDAMISGADASPLILNAVECNNPNNSTAYVTFYDASNSGATPSGAIYTFGIAANTSATVPVYNMRFNNGLWLGAITSSGVPVTTALFCQAQVNLHGPFF
jgi:hypothetical protein